MAFTFDQSKDEIATLVRHFHANLAQYRIPSFKEAHARQEYIDPFFMALNWDVQNRGHSAPDYREVVVEASLDMEGARKAPDYAFRLGRDYKFYVEAKKPGVNIKTGIAPAYQLRRYAWSKKLPLSILTDFEEFAIYDCRVRPAVVDKPSIARINYFTHEEYADRWQEIWDVFSRDAVWGGGFDQYAQSTRSRRGTSEVDTEFLKDLEDWRNLLAHNLALRNPGLTIDELNDAVQRTIDRMIFLRMAEDRGVEEYGRLQQIAEGEDVYAGLIKLCRQADARYNSGLFDFSKTGDRITPELVVDDKVLKTIFAGLYLPQSPYEFSVLPVEILGNVYEQFLGRVIHFTASHQARIEEKPEVKKAGGVYYTPVYIVNYIVKNTVGKQLEGKSPRQLKGFRVLDMACGSGSFLLGAYQCLLDYYLAWYTANEPEKHPKAVWLQGDVWKLTTTEKKRILIEHIFGVDIDRQAVEVTKLSLLLKVLEGENDESLTRQAQMELLPERALPNLDANIKCGNSLIGPDYFTGQLMPDKDDLRRVNPFDWEKEYPDAMQAGGFDCVIGNPPYLFITELITPDKNYYFRVYETTEYRFDVYGLFIELSIRKLTRKGGSISFITPHTLLSNDSYKKLRQMVIEKTVLELVVDIGPGVFQNAKNETMIFVARNTPHSGDKRTVRVLITKSQSFPKPTKEFQIQQNVWNEKPGAAWRVQISQDESEIMTKFDKCQKRLGEICTINQGLRTGDNDKYLSASQNSRKWKAAAGGKHVSRYSPLLQEIYVYYEPSLLDAPRRQEIFESSGKIVVQEIRNITLARRIIATYDDNQIYCLQSTNVINLRDRSGAWSIKYLLGILNSNAINVFFRNRFSGNNHIASNQLAQIPIPSANQIQQENMVTLVEQILDLHKRKASAEDGAEQGRLQRLVDSTDAQIDALVYELYGLTPEEIAIVEGKG